MFSNKIESKIESTLESVGIINSVSILTSLVAVNNSEFKFEYVYKSNKGRGSGTGTYYSNSENCIVRID